MDTSGLKVQNLNYDWNLNDQSRRWAKDTP